MKKKTLFIPMILIFLMTSSVSGSVLMSMEFSYQEKEDKTLAPKYRAFLAETQSIMTSKEKEVFFGLKNDRERNQFMAVFWKSRGGRQQGVRANINLLMLMQMVQVLDLSEDQVAKIMPALNKNEREKQDLQRDITGHMGVLRIMINEEPPYEPEEQEEFNNQLNGKLNILRELRSTLREKEIEFETFLKSNLTPLQQARYFIFSQEFYRGLRDRLEDARRTQQRLRLPTRKKR